MISIFIGLQEKIPKSFIAFMIFHALKTIFLKEMRLTRFFPGSPKDYDPYKKYTEVVVDQPTAFSGSETVVYYPTTPMFSQVIVSKIEGKQRKFYLVPIRNDNRFAEYFAKGFCRSQQLITKTNFRTMILNG